MREVAVVSYSLAEHFEQRKQSTDAPPGLVSLRNLCLVNSALVIMTQWGIAPEVLSGINIAVYKSKSEKLKNTKVEKFISRNKPFPRVSDACIANGKLLLFHRLRSKKGLGKSVVGSSNQGQRMWCV